MSATREFVLWAVGAAVVLTVVAVVDTDSPFREQPWGVPVIAVVAGLGVVAQGRLMRRARRRGAEARGMTLEESDARGREAERRFRARHPVLYLLAWIGVLALLGVAIWLRVT